MVDPRTAALSTDAEPPKLPSWICGIARNLARNERRKSARTDTSAELEAVPDARLGPLEALLEAESDAIVERALRSLDETYAEPLVLIYRQDLAEVNAVVAGDLMAQLVNGAGLRYEIVPAIEVRPAEDDE